jgi:hypothetical protein
VTYGSALCAAHHGMPMCSAALVVSMHLPTRAYDLLQMDGDQISGTHHSILCCAQCDCFLRRAHTFIRGLWFTDSPVLAFLVHC